MFGILLDFVVVIVFCVCVWVGFRRGFVASILSLGKFFAAMLLSWFISRTLAPMAFNTFFRSATISGVNNQLVSATNLSDLQEAIRKISDYIPDFLNNLIFDGQSISDLIPNQYGAGVYTISESIVDNFIGPLIIILLEVILFAILFIFIRLFFRWLVRVTSGIRRVPVIGTVNGLLGAVMGALLAVAYLMIAGMIIDIIILFTGDGLTAVNMQVINSTNLFLLFYKINPLRLF